MCDLMTRLERTCWEISCDECNQDREEALRVMNMAEQVVSEFRTKLAAAEDERDEARQAARWFHRQAFIYNEDITALERWPWLVKENDNG